MLPACHAVLPLDPYVARDGGTDLGHADAGADGFVDSSHPDSGTSKDAAPVHTWTMRTGGWGSDTVQAMALDGSGNIYLTGFYSGEVDFGGFTLTSTQQSNDIFLIKVAPDGRVLWAMGFGDGDYDHPLDIAVHTSGNIYLTGHYRGGLTFEGGTASVPGNGGYDVFVVKLDSTGGHVWSKFFGGVNADTGQGIALDAAERVYVAGTFFEKFSLPEADLSGAAAMNVFLLSYEGDGTYRWGKPLGSSDNDYAWDLATDANGRIYVSGSSNGEPDLGGGLLVNRGSGDLFVASYASNGDHRWSSSYGGAGADVAYHIAVDTAGNSYISGRFKGTADLGSGLLASVDEDMFVASYAPDGAPRWSTALGGSGVDHGEGVAVDASGNLYLAGAFSQQVQIGGTTMISAGKLDLLMASFTPAGVPRWSMQLGGAGNDLCRDIVVDGAQVYVTGYVSGTTSLGGAVFTSTKQDAFLVRIDQ